MRLMDLHVHSTCSADGKSDIADFVQRAHALGMAEIGFCEHVDFDPRDGAHEYLDPARYDREVVAAQAAVPEVQLRQGVEITYQAGLEGEIRTWLAGHAWDYVVGSVHLVDYADGWTIISEPRAVGDYFATHSQRQAYAPYFEELLWAVQSGLADVLGHFDLVKRFGVKHYGPFEPFVFEEEIRAVLRAAVEAGVALEINTSGLRQPPREPYPALTILRWYRQHGGEVLIVGSDAHHVDDLGAGVTEAIDLARAAGFQAIASFESQRVRWTDL